jgi:hypothetical protein
MIDPRRYKHAGIIGGFGSGKTYAIPLRWLSLIEFRAREQKTRCLMMIVEPTIEMIRDILVPTLNEWFDFHKVPHYYHKSNKNYTIKYKGYEFTAMLRSSDVPESLTGKNLTDIILDEFDKKHTVQKQRDVWKECISRIRKSEYGTVSPVTTPEGFKYTYEMYSPCEYGEKKNFKLIRAKTYDNPFIPRDYIDNMYDQYSTELVDQYIEAKFVNITQGRVYRSFDRKTNSSNKVVDKNLPIDLCLDFNVNPMVWEVAQQYREETHIVDEIYKTNTDTEEMAKEVGERYGFDTHYTVYGDYSGTGRDTRSRTTDYDILKSILPNVDINIKPNPTQINRVNAVNSRFKNSKGEHRCFVNVEKCPHLTRDLEQVVWSETDRKIDKKNTELTHASDGFGYRQESLYPLTSKPTIHHPWK